MISPKLEAVIGSWGRPPDTASKAAAAIAVVLLVFCLAGRGRSILGLGHDALPKKPFLWLAAFVAALLSIVYIAIYLQGGPRIIDATHYFLQGRALSHGSLAWPAPDPSGSFRGRFLLHHDTATGGVMGGIFPPGYPLVLALGFGVGAPMVVGPAIAAGLVIATYRLAHSLAEDAIEASLREPVARAAALLSVACITLRYHTADTMAHGAAALGITLAFDLALRAKRRGDDADGRLLAIGAGLAVGAVVATRPFSALGVGIVSVALLRQTRGLVVRLVLGMVPGVALLWFSQRAVTGSWWASSQRVYYAMSDAPADCFRWGFGKGVGCRLEHADFVESRLSKGYGVAEAAGVTLRRLHLHLRDIANLEPLALLVLAPLGKNGKTNHTRAAIAIVLLQIAAYVPFYFDGNYPGGGARFFADVLPIEHVLVVIAVAWLAGGGIGRPAAAARALPFARASYALLAVAFGSFAVHASFDQLKLRDRDGGKPMFEPDELARKYVTFGLMLVDTDHAFALGHDPFARAKDGLVVARFRDDDRDRLLYEQTGKPLAYTYKFDPRATPAERAANALVAWTPPPMGAAYRFEAEAEWPPLFQQNGVVAVGQSAACASNGKGLVLQPLEGEHATATIALPVPESGKWQVTLRIVHGVRIHTSIDAIAPKPGATIPAGVLRIAEAEWTWVDVPNGGCADLATKELVLTAPSARVTLEARHGPVTIDRFMMQKVK